MEKVQYNSLKIEITLIRVKTAIFVYSNTVQVRRNDETPTCILRSEMCTNIIVYNFNRNDLNCKQFFLFIILILKVLF